MNNDMVNPLAVSEVSLMYKTLIPSSNRPKITNSRDAFNILLPAWNNDTIELLEEFNILLLNRANKVLGMVNISKGGVSSTIVDAKIIFAAALKAMASSIVLAHNHPSGNVNPSQADIDITKKLCEGGKILDINILDHLVITPFDYYSFADEGIL